jgi:hypothetical protein
MEWLGKIITMVTYLLTSTFGFHTTIDNPIKNTTLETQKITQVSYSSSTNKEVPQKKGEVVKQQDITRDFDKNFSFFPYGNFLIPYPNGWEVFVSASHKGSYLDISPKNPSSVFRIQIHLVNQSSFVGGQEEVYEDSLEDGSVRKVRDLYLAGLKRNISEFSKKNDTSSIMYIVFTDYGGLDVNMYSSNGTNILLADNSEITPKDLTNLLLNNITITATATSSFETNSHKKYLGSHLSSDTKNIYYYNNIIIGADPETFKFVNATASDVAKKFGFDKNFVYGPYSNYNYLLFKKIEGADPLTFRVLGQEYAVDKNHVFYYALSTEAQTEDGPYLYQIIPEADPLSFKIVFGSSSLDAYDNGHVYRRGVLR